MEHNIQIIKATLAEYSIIQNLGHFYAYDLSRQCGFISDEWRFPDNGMYECIDFKTYFEDPDKKAFLIKVNGEVAGFCLLDHEKLRPETEWSVGEFFITAKFQGKGVANYVAEQIWLMHPALWELRVIPENQSALKFWRKAVAKFTGGDYREEVIPVDYDPGQPTRILLTFDTKAKVGG